MEKIEAKAVINNVIRMCILLATLTTNKCIHCSIFEF